GTGGLTKTGGGSTTLYLLGDNTYSGATSLQVGAILVTSVGGGATASSSLGSGAGALNLGTGSNAVSLLYVGAGETASRAINLTSTQSATAVTLRLDASGTGALRLTGPLNNNAT